MFADMKNGREFRSGMGISLYRRLIIGKETFKFNTSRFQL